MSAPATPIPHESGALSESQAVERLLAKSQAGLTPEPRTPEELLDDRDETAPPAEGEAAAADQADPDNAQTEGDEFAENADGEEVATTSAAADPLVKFDDGSELALSEVKRGFLRMQDYTRKTQEVATERKSVATERQQYLAEKQAIADRLGPLIQHARSIVDGAASDPALAELRVTDPGAFAVRTMEINARRAQLAGLEAEQHRLREQAQREEQERFVAERRQAAEQSRQVLMEKIPAFKKDFRAEYQKLGEYVLSQGVSPELWDNEVDHSVITLAWKAMQHDAAARKAPATKEQLRKAPQPLRPGAARPPGYAQARAVREATERAHKSGSIEDAIAAQKIKLTQGARR